MQIAPMQALIKQFLLICAFLITVSAIYAQPKTVKTGADRSEIYLPLLKNKRVGIFANHTSVLTDGNKHLVDFLREQGVEVKKIYAPEHGFRGTADAGEKVESTRDPQTGIPIVSLYGSKLAPSKADLDSVDILIFDIQDVGVRFYTYISSLEYYMKAAIENDLPLLVFDRPNPNGFYVDGPVLKPNYRSFVGMQPIPIVYGMTMGEYAKMLLGENWVKHDKQQVANRETGFSLKVIPCANYTHTTEYILPVKPSPNLPDQQSIYLYPSTCFFEGTPISLGRGTAIPFQVYGHPDFPNTLYSFTPKSVEGARNPPLLNKQSFGYNLSELPIDIREEKWQQIQLEYVLRAYKLFPNKNNFFSRPSRGNPSNHDYFFNKLAGSDQLMKQIMNGKTEQQIRDSWKADIAAFKKIRKKYLLYPDFE